MMNNLFIRVVVGATMMLISVTTIQAQENKISLGLDYTTELQSNFGKKVNWVNLLSFDAEYRPWRNGELSLNTISVWKSRKERIVNDLQTFSNIEEDNMAINILFLGYTHRFKNMNLFTGVRNVNMDYFTEDYTSLFTNSSCGIYPTLSVNLPIANYPIAAMCLHGWFEFSQNLTLKNSLYNGSARKLISNEGGGSVFSINPKKDGILNMTELSYSSKTNTNYGFYSIGSVLHSGDSVYEVITEKKRKTKLNYALWGSVEKSLYSDKTRSIGILLHGSFAPSNYNDCKHYYGFGVIFKDSSIDTTRDKNTFGVFYNRATFQENIENTIEATWKHTLNKHCILQTAVHCITTGSKTDVLGLLRLYIVI